jgi:hypothetical protein
MHLACKQHFHEMADVPNKSGSLEYIIFQFLSASITRLSILSWRRPPGMLYMHVAKRSTIKFLYFGPL